MRLSLRRPTEELPFYSPDVVQPTTFRFGRWWRSIPRLKRVLLVMFTLSIIFYLFVSYSRAEEQPNLINQGAIEIIQENAMRIKSNNKESAIHINNDLPEAKKPIALEHAQDIPVFLGPQNAKQKAVQDAFKHAWAGYKKFAWGHDQLKPQSGGFSEWFDLGLTITDSLDTAILMGLKEEVAEGTEWIRDKLHFDKNRYVNLFETTIRVLGGLLSSYHLTGDTMFIDKAKDLGDRLLNGFVKSKSVVPLSDVNLATGDAKSPPWSDESSLSEATSLQLEFRELSRLTGNNTYEEISFKVSEHIHQMGCDKHGGLCEMFLVPSTGRFRESTTITFGARADSYYEYLLKQWLQTGKSIEWLRADYEKAMSSMSEKLLRETEPSKYKFVGELLSGQTFSPKMDHLVCFLSGTLALGANNSFPAEHLDIAKGIGQACRAMYDNPTGLGPEIAYYNMLPGSKFDLTIKPLDAHSLLRPEAIEAWFYLYRMTGDKIYQEWGWNAFQAIERYAKLPNGYSSVNSVKRIPVTYRDLMESFYLAETLKYLYLLFADDQSELSFDKWVFNTEAHPLPIRSH